MSTIDQFESVFRSAMPQRYEPRPFPIHEALLLSSFEDAERSAQYLAAIERLLEGDGEAPKATTLPPERTRDLAEMGSCRSR